NALLPSGEILRSERETKGISLNSDSASAAEAKITNKRAERRMGIAAGGEAKGVPDGGVLATRPLFFGGRRGRRRPLALIESRNSHEHLFELREVLVLGQRRLLLAQMGKFEFEFVTLLSQLRREFAFVVARNERQLMCPGSIRLIVSFGLLHSADAGEPSRRSSQTVGVIFQQGVFCREAAFGCVVVLDLLRGTEPRLENRGLSVLVEVSGGICNGSREVASKARIVNLRPALSGGNDCAIATG